MSFIKTEKEKNRYLIANVFDGDKGKGNANQYGNKTHILKDGQKNLYKDIRKGGRDSASDYYINHNITWHKKGDEPTGSTISSQIACLNHLFTIRNDDAAVKKIVGGINKKFVNVLPIDEKTKNGSLTNTLIAFEVIGRNNLLSEHSHKRGANCTSIDALIYAEDSKQNKTIILIEWKYTEAYSDEDKSTEKKKDGSDGAGKTRMQLYNKLIQKSNSLKSLCVPGKTDDYYSTATEYEGSVYYQEPFYQLMRQTLWAELMTGKIKNAKAKIKEKDPIVASDYLHIHIMPKGNTDLLDKGFKKLGEIWKKRGKTASNLTGERDIK